MGAWVFGVGCVVMKFSENKGRIIYFTTWKTNT